MQSYLPQDTNHLMKHITFKKFLASNNRIAYEQTMLQREGGFQFEMSHQTLLEAENKQVHIETLSLLRKPKV
jgi:hypothetical protein